MDITIMRAPVDGMLAVQVSYKEVINGFSHSGELSLWVAESDSRKEIEQRARVAAADFLARCLQAHAG